MFIIYHTRAYARHLPRELGVTSVFPNQKRYFRRKQLMDVFVNWGCSPDIVARLVEGTESRVLNPDVTASVQKVRAFELLGAANLPFPRMTRNADEDGFFERGKYLGRKDGLSGGKGIVVYEKGQRPTQKHDFYAQVVAKALETRIHVGRNPSGAYDILCEQIKYVPAGSKVLIRNFGNGARFSAVPLHQRIDASDAQKAREIAIAAAQACSMDFAAVDMALTKKGEWTIFELNSAPGLMRREDTDTHEMPATFDAYLTYFRQFMKG